MSRGGWIMIIGGVVLLVGISLFAFGVARLIPNPELTTLSPGAFLNRTVDVVQVGSAVVYQVGIPEPMSGDEVTVFIRTPSGGSALRMTVTGANPPPQLHFTTETGLHTAVIQNTGGQTVGIFYWVDEIDTTALTLVSVGTFLGLGGFIVFIVGLVFWILDRGRRRRQQMVMPPPPP